MSSYNILVVENTPEPRIIAEALEYIGHNVMVCTNLCDAEFYTCDNYQDENAMPIDFILLDLTMNRRDLPKELREEASEIPAGWVFYDKILKVKNPILYKRTIFYTAYWESLKQLVDIDTYNSLNILPKNSDNLVTKAIEMMNSIIVMEAQEGEGNE